MTRATSTGPSAGKMVLFLLLFLIPASLTYLSGPLLGAAALDEATADDAWAIRLVFLVPCYALMTLACYLRGRAVDRVWLVAFPIVGAVFDLALPVVPFVPSVMNIVVLAAGIPTPRQVPAGTGESS